ncbi:MAG: glycosyl hydrolase family 28-related protein [Kiritimatiellia bacterium]
MNAKLHLPIPIFLLFAVPFPSHAMPERIFPENAVVDVTKAPYFAVPNDGKDDSPIIQQAISDVVGTGTFLYFPPGIYDFDRPLVCTNSTGLFRPHITFQGAGADRTVFRISDASPCFSNPNQPRALLTTGSFQEENDPVDGGGNKAFRNHVQDLSISIGNDNPGAVAINWAVSNIGTIENVRLLNPDGKADCAIALRRSIPGPGLIKNVTIEGFRTGLDLCDLQYGITAVNLSLSNQTFVGIHLGKNLLHADRLQSRNSVPTILNDAQEGSITLLHADLRQPDTATTPMLSIAGSLLILDSKLHAPTLLRGSHTLLSGSIPYFYRTPDHPTGTSTPARTPEIPSFAIPPPPFDAVNGFSLTNAVLVGNRLPGEDNDLPAIQRAFATRRSAVFLQTGKVYFIPDTIEIPNHVTLFHGMGAELNLGPFGRLFSNPSSPYPVIRIPPSRPAQSPVWFEHVFFNTQYPGVALFQNNAACNLILRHVDGWVGAAGKGLTLLPPNAPPPRHQGAIFAEDVFLPNWHFQNQSAILVQFNPENFHGDGSISLVSNTGGKIAILGFKTEGPAPFLVTQNGRSSLFGGYNYISATAVPIPTNAVPFETVNGVHFIHTVTDNFSSRDYPVYLRERTKNGDILSQTTPDKLPMRSPGINWHTIHDFSSAEILPDVPTPLPYKKPVSPLLFGNRTIPADRQEWEQTVRPAILDALARLVYGKLPPKNLTPELSYKIIDDTPNALDGLARRLQIDLTFSPAAQHPWRILLYLPAHAKGPVPIFWGLNFMGNQSISNDPGILIPDWYNPVRPRGSAAYRYDLQQILKAGHGLATMRHYEAEPDHVDGWKDGIRGALLNSTVYPAQADDTWGCVAAWSWALSRGMDLFEKLPDLIGSVTVWGHSRLGKAALYAAACDPRFAAVISNCSGCTGASLSCSILPDGKSETIRAINDQFPHWFCPTYKQFNNREEDLPIDQHHLLALIAPRPLLIQSAEQDAWADPAGEFQSTLLAAPVWELYGHPAPSPDTPMPPLSKLTGSGIYYCIRPGIHDVTPENWKTFLLFAP